MTDKASDLLAQIGVHGQAIGEAARAGDEKAKRVVRYYTMWHTCPGDGMAKTLTEEAFKEWLAARPTSETTS